MKYRMVQTIREAVTCAVESYERFAYLGKRSGDVRLTHIAERRVDQWRMYLADDRQGRINKLKEI